jgi:putative copper resistance protein D
MLYTLLRAGAWLGGLAPFILCLKHIDDPRMQSDASRALQGFSTWGHVFVPLIVLTGIVNTALTLGAWPIDMSSPYQVLQGAKIIIVMMMIATAIFNRYVRLHRLKIDPDAPVY